MKRIFTTVLCFCMVVFAFGQGTITGTVTDAETGEALMGATVLNKTTNLGTATGLDGTFTMEGLEDGRYPLEISFVGYATMTIDAVVENGTADLGNITMGLDAIGLSQVNVVAQMAIDRKTPVAVSTISGKTIEMKMGNQEFTEVMKFSPSVMATKNSSTGGNSGGFGDGSIVVRGFAQENVALLINGIPVNGMEDNRIYWSNWAGLGDVTRTIQIQRGLGSTSLSVASIGGTINIVTKTTDQERGGSILSSIGNDGYRKLGLTLSTGKLDNGWAFTFSGSRTVADGYIEGGYLDAWNYFVSMAKEIGQNHLISFTAFGAPQRHGQRDFAPSIGLQRDVYGPKYNDDYGTYRNQDYLFRDNFFHKPQIALNHYWTINEKTTWTNSVYTSIGRGGGTGDLGGLRNDADEFRGNEFRQPKDAYGHQQFDEIELYNRGLPNNLYNNTMSPLNFEMANGDTGSGQIAVPFVNGLIKRASMNEHEWYGLLSKLDVNLSSTLTLSGGLDMRWYHGSHYRKTIDLLGADYWFDRDNINNRFDWVDINGDGIRTDDEMGVLVRPKNDVASRLFGQEDDNQRIDYHNDEDINWYGAFGRIEYSNNDLSAFASAAVNYTQMRRYDYFLKRPGDQITDWTDFLGYTAKIGANYNLNESNNVFVNLGYISRAPYFDALYPTFNNDELNEDAETEKILAAEIGYGYRARKFRVNVNGYMTQWKDKAETSNFGSNNQVYFLNLLGVDALHMGIEVDFTAAITKDLNFNGFASVGSWEWRNNPTGSVSDENNNVIETVELYLDGLKVGNAAQTTAGIGFDYTIAKQLTFDWQTIFYENFYAAFNPEDRDDEALLDVQPLKLPFYSLTDIGLTWQFKFMNHNAFLRANVNNLFDEEYVTWAEDNVEIDDKTINDDRDSEDYKKKLDGARGWFGFGRTWNLIFKMNF
jgi:iron complex outermembrane recepter protein